MKSWTVQEAEAGFDDLLDACLSEGTQFLPKGGSNVAVLVSLEEWQRLSRSATPSPGRAEA